MTSCSPPPSHPRARPRPDHQPSTGREERPTWKSRTDRRLPHAHRREPFHRPPTRHLRTPIGGSRLSGSTRHLLGGTATQSHIVHVGSFTQGIVGTIERGLREVDGPEERTPTRNATFAVTSAVANLDGPEEKLEFLARRLLIQQSSGELLDD